MPALPPLAPGLAEPPAAAVAAAVPPAPQERGPQGFQGYSLSILRIRYLVPRRLFCVAFACLAIIRVEGCLNSTLLTACLESPRSSCWSGRRAPRRWRRCRSRGRRRSWRCRRYYYYYVSLFRLLLLLLLLLALLVHYYYYYYYYCYRC